MTTIDLRIIGTYELDDRNGGNLRNHLSERFAKDTLDEQSLIDMQESLRAKDLFMIIIDEVSNVSPHLLERVNQRLKQIRSCSLPFGGLCVLLVGDFLQKPPPGAISLVKGLMYMIVQHERNNKKDSPYRLSQKDPYPKVNVPSIKDMTSNTTMGLCTFKLFRLFMLKEQQRASTDKEHTAILEKLSQKHCKITINDLMIYKQLTKEDLNKQFANATFIVSTNRERSSICFHMAQFYAIRHNCPLIRWKLEVTKWLNRPSQEEENDLLTKDPIFHDHFVPGMEGYLIENLNVALMIGNGTKIRYHSLSFKSKKE